MGQDRSLAALSLGVTFLLLAGDVLAEQPAKKVCEAGGSKACLEACRGGDGDACLGLANDYQSRGESGMATKYFGHSCDAKSPWGCYLFAQFSPKKGKRKAAPLLAVDTATCKNDRVGELCTRVGLVPSFWEGSGPGT